MALEIMGIPQSNTTRAVRMAALEKGAAFEFVIVAPQSPEAREFNPLGKVPIMRHDGFILWESAAIARYIDATFDGPPLMPSDPRQAAVIEQWISMITTALDIVLVRNYVLEYLFNKDDDGNVVRDLIDRSVKKFPILFGAIDKAVAGGFVGGSAFTLGDCHLAPTLGIAPRFPESGEEFGKYPALADYMARIGERASFKDTAPPPS